MLGVKLQHVYDGGAAQAAGLSGGDVVVAVDGLRITDPDKLTQRLNPGAAVALHAFRRDELLVFEVTPKALPADTCRLSLIENVKGVWPKE